MKKRNPFFIFSIVLSFLFGFAFSSFAQEHKDTPSGKAVNQKIKKLQIPFIANEGQADEKVAYYANTFGGTVFVTKDGEIVYSLPKGSDVENTDCRGELHSPYMIHDAGCGIHYNHKSCIKSCRLDEACPAPVEGMERTQQISDPHSPTPKSQPPTPNTFLQGIALKETLIGAKVKEIKGEDKSATKINYFKGNDQKKWKSNISTYDVVNLGEVYKGIELKLKAYGNNVEKLFHVKPGADPNRIKIRLSGIQPPESSSTKGSLAKSPLTKGGRGVVSPDVWVNEQGELVAETELGPVTFTKPIAYQEIDGKRVEVEVKYVIRDYEPIAVKYSMNTGTDNGHVSRTYGFAVASYDKTKELVIDPLLASTYLGGSSEDYAHAISLDSEENVYVAGYTGSTDFPITEGSYSASYSGEDYDVFVSKLNSDLTSLLASTYLGGSEMDFAYSMDIDSSGNVYITGNTYSSDFPATLDAYNSSRNDSTYCDLFISKLDSNLSSLLESTYLGGNNYDYVECIDVDANGNVYVAGYTHSSNFPTTSGAYDVSYNGFRSDSAFVSKLSSNLNSLLASTFFGGQDDDCIKSLAVDTSGNIYVTGYTYSQDFPTTAGAYDTSYYNDEYYYSDAFVSKLNSNLTNLIASTFLSGNDDSDYANSVVLDTGGNVYVTGRTYSSDFPTTTGAYDKYGNTSFYYEDIFVSKLNSNLDKLLASTFLGGSDSDSGEAIALDKSGNVYITGYTHSTDFPITSGTYDTSGNTSYQIDVFVSKLDSSLANLLASTYLGGHYGDSASALAINTNNDVYVTGKTNSSDFPTSTGAYDISSSGSEDIFISKMASNLSADNTPPEVDSVSPADGSIDVSVSTELTVTFNEAIDSSTINTVSFIVSSNGDEVNGSVTYDSNTFKATFIPSNNLLYSTNYMARITTDVKDIVGNAINSDYTWNFFTEDDTTPPNGSISINNGDTYTNSTSVTVSLAANDNIGVAGYYISDNPIIPSSTIPDWISIYSTTSFDFDVSYTLSDGDGTNTIYVWYKDDTGNISDTYSDSIILDTTSPEINIISPTTNDTYSTNISVVSVWGNASDATSGISTVKWENNKGGSGTASGTTSWSISNIGLLVDVENVITVTAKDNAGNSASYTITVTYSELTTLKGKIFGYVMDEHNTSIESVKVTCKGKNTGVNVKEYTNKKGYFEFNNLDADTYKIVAKTKGYYKSKYNVNLDAGKEKEVEIVLEEK